MLPRLHRRRAPSDCQANLSLPGPPSSKPNRSSKLRQGCRHTADCQKQRRNATALPLHNLRPSLTGVCSPGRLACRGSLLLINPEAGKLWGRSCGVGSSIAAWVFFRWAPILLPRSVTSPARAPSRSPGCRDGFSAPHVRGSMLRRLFLHTAPRPAGSETCLCCCCAAVRPFLGKSMLLHQGHWRSARQPPSLLTEKTTKRKKSCRVKVQIHPLLGFKQRVVASRQPEQDAPTPN